MRMSDSPNVAPSPAIRRNCDFCVRKKVRCPGDIDGRGCASCRKKGFLCVYSPKKKPGPKSKTTHDEVPEEVPPTSAAPSRESKATAYALSKLCGASGGGGVGVRRSSSFEVDEGRQVIFPGALDQLGTPKKKAGDGHDLGSPTKKARTRKDGRRTLNARLERSHSVNIGTGGVGGCGGGGGSPVGPPSTYHSGQYSNNPFAFGRSISSGMSHGKGFSRGGDRCDIARPRPQQRRQHRPKAASVGMIGCTTGSHGGGDGGRRGRTLSEPVAALASASGTSSGRELPTLNNFDKRNHVDGEMSRLGSPSLAFCSTAGSGSPRAGGGGGTPPITPPSAYRSEAYNAPYATHVNLRGAPPTERHNNSEAKFKAGGLRNVDGGTVADAEAKAKAEAGGNLVLPECVAGMVSPTNEEPGEFVGFVGCERDDEGFGPQLQELLQQEAGMLSDSEGSTLCSSDDEGGKAFHRKPTKLELLLGTNQHPQGIERRYSYPGATQNAELSELPKFSESPAHQGTAATHELRCVVPRVIPDDRKQRNWRSRNEMSDLVGMYRCGGGVGAHGGSGGGPQSSHVYGSVSPSDEMARVVSGDGSRGELSFGGGRLTESSLSPSAQEGSEGGPQSSRGHGFASPPGGMPQVSAGGVFSGGGGRPASGAREQPRIGDVNPFSRVQGSMLPHRKMTQIGGGDGVNVGSFRDRGERTAASSAGARGGSENGDISLHVPGSTSPGGGVPLMSGGGGGRSLGCDDGGHAVASTRPVGPSTEIAQASVGRWDDGPSALQHISGGGGGVGGAIRSKRDGSGASFNAAAQAGEKAAADSFPLSGSVEEEIGAVTDCSWLDEEAGDELSHFLNDIVDSEFSLDSASAVSAEVFC